VAGDPQKHARVFEKIASPILLQDRACLHMFKDKYEQEEAFYKCVTPVIFYNHFRSRIGTIISFLSVWKG
jgi:hypothetical protein